MSTFVQWVAFFFTAHAALFRDAAELTNCESGVVQVESYGPRIYAACQNHLHLIEQHPNQAKFALPRSKKFGPYNP